MRTTFIEQLIERADKDRRIFLLVGDLGFGVVDEFRERFPDRFLNVGVAEQNMIGVAAGLAKSGFKPFVYSIANFPSFRCLEQIRNDVSYGNRDVTIVSLGAGFSYGAAGYSHHAIEDIAAVGSLPNMTIYNPADNSELLGSLNAIFNSSGPNYLRLGKGGNGRVTPVDVNRIPRRLKSGSKFAVISTGEILDVVNIAVAQIEEKFNVELGVFSATILSPIEIRAMDFLDYHTLLSIEEHITIGGLGARLAFNITQLDIPVRLKSLGISNLQPDVIGDQNFLREVHGLDILAIKKFLRENLGIK
jgi:transketolase